jgi:dTDP-4-amino-4,6-dideoxygalactose transaminase
MDRIPVMRPQLPTADELLPYLRRIDEARYYTNFGSLLHELEARLADFYGVSPSQLALAANGTVALSAALLAVGAKPGKRCLLPSWTFVGTAAAAWAANLEPYFVDVDEATWMLDARTLASRRDLERVGAVIVVSAFGAPVDTAAWDAFTDQTGIPAIIDCAASFDTVHAIERARPGRSPIMVSLHATKAFGIGEGGFVVSTDDDTMLRFRQICNFGVWGPPGQIMGYNGKLSEYHCAVGLAQLDSWPKRREQLARLTKLYADVLGKISELRLLPTYGRGWVSCYCNVATSTPAAPLIERLRECGIDTRRWWQSGVHVQPAYRDFPCDHLPVTRRLSERVIGLPFYHDMDDEQFTRVVAAVQSLVMS